MRTCPKCYALVGQENFTAHEAWHKWLEKKLRGADGLLYEAE